jgi:peptidoglycan/xylan/chitin deacetylase (PgdA/CDA1 family)
MPRQLSITFDDGPDELWTRRLLRVLDDHAVRATFFLVGERVLGAPLLVGQMLESAHEIQLHCHSHVRHTKMSEAEIEQDAWAALEALADLGVEPTRWRTPWGVRTPATEAVAARLGLGLVGWEIDTHDWRGDSATEMLARVQPLLPAGGSVLMHDGLGPGALRIGCANTIELVERMIPAALAAGIAVGPLAALGDGLEHPGAPPVGTAVSGGRS